MTLPVLVLNPPLETQEVNMPRRKVSAYASFAAPYMRRGGGGLLAAARAWRARNPENPWVQGYSYTLPARPERKVTVKPFFRTRPGVPRPSRIPPMPKKYKLPRPAKTVETLSPYKMNPWVRGYTYFSPSAGKMVHVRGYMKSGRKALRRNQTFVAKVGTVYNPRRRNPDIAPFQYSVSPVVANPIGGLFENPENPLKDQATAFLKALTAKEFLVDNLLPLGGGFLGSRLITTRVVYPLYVKKAESAKTDQEKADRAKRLENFGKYKAWIEVGSGMLAGLVAGIAFKSTPIALRVGAGGIIGGLVTYIEGTDQWKKWSAMESYEGIGQSVTEEVRKRLAAAVKSDVKAAEAGISAYLTEEQAMSGGGVGAYLTEEAAEGTKEFAQPMPMGDMASGISVDDFMAGPSIGV